MHTITTLGVIQIQLSAAKFGRDYTLYIAPSNETADIFGVWLTQPDSAKILYLYCIQAGPTEALIKDALANAPMYIDFYVAEFDDDDFLCY